MASMTFAEAAEHVLREVRTAMPIKALWAAISDRGLVESKGETPEATLQVELARRAANSSIASKLDGPPRFYRRGDGAYGLWAHLAPEQQRAVADASRAALRVSQRALTRDLAEVRNDPELAGEVFESLVAEDSRRVIGSLFAKLIRDAHAIHPGCWKLTVRPNDWRLVIGQVRILKLARQRLSFLCVADLKELAPAEQALLGALSSIGPKRPPRGMDSVVYRILPVDLEQSTADAAHAAIRPPASAYAKRAHGQVHDRRTHSPGAIEYLSKLLGAELPRPVYTSRSGDNGDEVGDSTHRKTALDELLAEYIGGYLSSPKGKEFLASYEAERRAARANLERIEALEHGGQDPTDAILLWLLPHTDTAKHREQGAWIYHAANIHRDIRVWFERNGWVRSEDWPGVAKLVLDFLRDSVRDPSQITRHIAAFADQPLSKGFGVGMLTPILNALAPDRYPLCNRKVVRVISYFGDVELESTFDDYPAMIEQFRKLVASQPRLHDPRLGARPEDVFDHFCHWLVSVRKYAFADVEEPEDDSPPDDENDDETEASPDDVQSLPPEPPVAEPPPPPYSIDDALAQVFLSRDELTRLRDLLEYKRNLVLQGPPGVGKTFVAAELAYVLLGGKDEHRIKRVQFHQSYAYEDFVRGYRPRPGGGFEYRDGPMLEFCDQARRDGRPHVMIIDEINRGNLGKILGELMLLIEPDKRKPDWAVALAYARPGEPPFWIPPNLFVIGTMNTADRSLALVDYALRRRFAFAWVLPAFGPSFRGFLERQGAAAEIIDKIFTKLAKLNAVIEKDTRNLGRGYVLGHSYFCQKDPSGRYDIAWYERIVRFEIEPLLEEYFAQDPDKVAELVAGLLS